ncbi:MAG: class I SAM-dependent methyltransferase [Candidatus Magasanikbacteria bacterium]|nr:class I SAM-dependent methyltransferase [Candidatus Magasanikbacteria bacterium]
MRPEFVQITSELEKHDAWFRDVLSQKTTLPTEMESWSVTRDVAEKLYELALKYTPKHIVEVGTSLGYSTIWLAEASREYGGFVDTLENEASKILKAQETFDRLGYKNVQIHFGDAIEILKNWSSPVDFVFLDARKREYVRQVQLLEPYLTKNASIIADDVTEWRRKLDEFFAYLGSGNYTYEILELGHGLLVAQKVEKVR